MSFSQNAACLDCVGDRETSERWRSGPASVAARVALLASFGLVGWIVLFGHAFGRAGP